MNNHIDELLYRSGLTAQGCWEDLDQYARNAIVRAIEITAQDCSDMCMSQADRKNIRNSFGLKVESDVRYPSPDPHNSITSQYDRPYNLPKS